jgi:hypothetical protein
MATEDLERPPTGGTAERGGLLLLALLVLGALALGVAAWQLADSQRDRRTNLEQRFAERASIAGSLVDSLFGVILMQGAPENAERYGAEVETADLDAAVGLGNSVYIVVLDADGRVLGRSSDTPAAAVRRLAGRPRHVRAALDAGYGLSDVLSDPAVVEVATAFEGDEGPRVHVAASPVSAFVAFLGGTLAPLPAGYERGEAHVLDGRGRPLGAASGGLRGGAAVASPELVAASARETEGSREVDGRATYFAAAPVRQSGWREAPRCRRAAASRPAGRGAAARGSPAGRSRRR